MTGRGKPLTGAERMRNLRARRAAGLAPPVDGPVLRDPADLLAPAVEATLGALDLAEADAAAAQLARRYAATIDEARDQAWAIRWIAPGLLATLEQLRATPASRAAAKPVKAEPGPLDRLRAARHSGGAG